MKRITESDLVDDVVKALRQLEGRASKSQVEKRIYGWHESAFNDPYFQETIANDTVVRWKHYIAWARLQAQRQGLIAPISVSGRGWWQLTEKGWGR